MMCDKQLVLRLSRLCREVDRQYEFNNNGQLDNGVYHKQINNTTEDKKSEESGSADEEADKDKKKSKKKAASDDEDDETRFQVMQCSKSMGMEFLTEDWGDIKLEGHNKRDKTGRMIRNEQDLRQL